MEEHVFDPAAFDLPAQPDSVVPLPVASATRRLGELFGKASRAGDWIGLIGNLGAGKTTFTQGLCGAFGVSEATSPTYTLLNVYRGDPSVFHFDLYRLDTVGDLEGIGYWDYVESGEGVTVVEWIDQIPEGWPGSGTFVELVYDGEGREAHIWKPSAELARLLDEEDV